MVKIGMGKEGRMRLGMDMYMYVGCNGWDLGRVCYGGILLRWERR